MDSDVKEIKENVVVTKKRDNNYKVANLELLRLVHQADKAGMSYGKFVDKNKL